MGIVHNRVICFLILISAGQVSAISPCEMKVDQVGYEVDSAVSNAEFFAQEDNKGQGSVGACMHAAKAKMMIGISLNILGKKTTSQN